MENEGKHSKTVEKYNVRANVWQNLPDLVVPRAQASGCIMGDFLYVFGGIGGQSTIERLNLKLNMVRTGDKFEKLEVKLPNDAFDIGVIPQLNQNELLLIGGFSENKCINQNIKFSAIQSLADDGSQPNTEYSIEEVMQDESTKIEMKPDFFSSSSMMVIDPENAEVITIFGA